MRTGSLVPSVNPMSGTGKFGELRMTALTRSECIKLLYGQGVGRLAVNGDGVAPLVRPVNYVFDANSQSVVFRTAAGSKLHSLRRETHAAFEVDDLDPDTHTGWSVIIVGAIEPLVRPGEIRRAEALGLEPWTPEERENWVRIRAWTVSGRRIGVWPGGPDGDPLRGRAALAELESPEPVTIA